MNSTEKRSWGAAFGAFIHPRVITMLFLGLSAGIPILLIFSTLSIWLREAGVDHSQSASTAGRVAKIRSAMKKGPIQWTGPFEI